jgi:hypothetical protein
MANRIIPMILIVEVFTHKCFDDNYHKIAYTSKHINIVEISFYNIAIYVNLGVSRLHRNICGEVERCIDRSSRGDVTLTQACCVEGLNQTGRLLAVTRLWLGYVSHSYFVP